MSSLADGTVGQAAPATATQTGYKDASGNLQPFGAPSSAYTSPNGNRVATGTTLDSLFSDDFGGNSILTSNWDVIDGGLGAVTSGSPLAPLGSTPTPSFSQAKIGSGTTGITDSVSASGLSVVMGTTLGAERWYLSRQVFAGKEDILVLLSKSQSLAANSIFIGLVEVDAVTFIPLLNPNFAADGNGAAEFTNRGGCEFGLSATNTAYSAEAIGDSSASKASGATGVAGSTWVTSQEALIEIDSRDIIVSTAAVDSVAIKAAGASRVSSQCPNDKKLYKLLMRFRNVTAPGSSTTVAVLRVLVADNYEQRVQISSGEGDQLANKGVPVNIAASVSLSATLAGSSASIGYVQGASASVSGTNNLTDHKLIALGTTNATSLKGTAGKIFNGWVYNTTASVKFLKFYNKATAPTVGTDTPIWTLPIPANGGLAIESIVGLFGKYFSTGIAYALTGAAADADTTALTAGDVIVNLGWV